MFRVHEAYIAAYAPSREHLQIWTRSVEENIEMGVCVSIEQLRQVLV